MASEKPILFSAPMVRAIIAGKKTQTRRVVKPQPIERPGMNCTRLVFLDRKGREKLDEAIESSSQLRNALCPYGGPGSLLWVRETWMEEYDPHSVKPYDPPRYIYAATHEGEDPILMDGDGFAKYRKDGTLRSPWCSPLRMPRVASRLSLRVLSVRVERVQDITREDAKAEGFWPSPSSGLEMWNGRMYGNAQLAFQACWQEINEKRAPWSSNPWVWVVEFERVAQAVPHG